MLAIFRNLMLPESDAVPDLGLQVPRSRAAPAAPRCTATSTSFLSPFLTCRSALYRPARAVGRALLGAHGRRMLIDGVIIRRRDPTACPNWGPTAGLARPPRHGLHRHLPAPLALPGRGEVRRLQVPPTRSRSPASSSTLHPLSPFPVAVERGASFDSSWTRPGLILFLLARRAELFFFFVARLVTRSDGRGGGGKEGGDPRRHK